MLRILLFNRNEPYSVLLARTPHQFDVLTPQGRSDGAGGWNNSFRPLPRNCVEVSLGEAMEGARSGRYDLIVCMASQDLDASRACGMPGIYAALHMMEDEPGFREVGRDQAIEGLGELPGGVEVVYVSEKKQRDWGWPGEVVAPGIDVSDYCGYEGTWPRVLRVGNFLRERNVVRGFSIQETILNGGDTVGFLGGRLVVPSTILGVNPAVPGARQAKSWEELKTQYRCHRLFLSTLPPDHEDGYNLALLEAMAIGMPVVALANPSCPIVDGENGFVSDDPRVLRKRILDLLRDPDLARQLGERARHTVTEQFGIDRFVTEWDRIFRRVAGGGPIEIPLPVETAMPVAASQEDDSVFAWTAADVERAVADCQPEEFHLLGFRLERLAPGRWWGDLIAYREDRPACRQARHRPMMWRGVSISAEDGDCLSLSLPKFLDGLPSHWKEDVAGWMERGIRAFVSDPVRREAHRAVLAPPLPDGVELFDRDWIVPDKADARSYLRRAQRYRWASRFAEGVVVIDLACGVGEGSRLLARRARMVVGVDPDPRAVSFASRSHGGERLSFQAADSGRLPFADESFDLAVSVGLWSPSEEAADSLSEVLRVLKPSGRVLIAGHLENRKVVANRLEERFETVVFWGQRPEMGKAEITEEFAIESLGATDDAFVAMAESPRVEEPLAVGAADQGSLWALHPSAAPGFNGK